jgi:carbon monoxide dehydrogenase subunit G
VRELVFGIEVRGSQQAVWDALVDWERQGTWMPLTRLEVLDGGTGLGTRIVARTGVGPVGVADRMTVTAWDPPRSATVVKTGRVLRGSAAFEVRPVSEHVSRVVWHEALEVPFGRWGRPLGPLLAVGTKVFFGSALRRFARGFPAGVAA